MRAESRNPILGLMGLPGCGKGTQAALLVERFGFLHLSSGDLLRQEIQKRTPVGLRAEEVIRRGQLMPDKIVGEMIRGQIEPPHRQAERVLLDGYPRTLGQLKDLDELLGILGKPFAGVFYLDVPREVIIERLGGRRICPVCAAVYHLDGAPPCAPDTCDACGHVGLVQRPDDAPQTIRRRIEEFEQATQPLVEALERDSRLWHIDAERPPKAIHESIAADLEKCLADAENRAAQSES